MIFPNLYELSKLAGKKLTDDKSIVSASMELLKQYNANAFFVTGIVRGQKVKDVLVQKGKEVVWFERKRLDVGRVRGTGCRLSSAIAALLAHKFVLPQAVEIASSWLHENLKNNRVAVSPGVCYIL